MAAPLSAQRARALWLEHLAHERRASPRTLEAYGFAAGRYIAFLEQHRGETLDVPALAASFLLSAQSASWKWASPSSGIPARAALHSASAPRMSPVINRIVAARL